ncbi:MAG: thioredoxin family protein [Dysgonamonadaceae bacterium]
MKIKINTILLILLFLSTAVSIAQNYTFKLNLSGKKYEQVCMKAGQSVIRGKPEGIYSWVFDISQKEYEQTDNFYFLYKEYDDESETEYMIAFQGVIGKDTLLTYYTNFSPDNMTISASYINTMKKANIPKRKNKDGEHKIVQGNIISDAYLVTFPGNADLRMRMMYPYFSLFYQEKSREIQSYDEFLRQYEDICRHNPGSIYLISALSKNIFLYNAKADVKKLFDLFSEEAKKSFWGQRINSYLTYFDFENIVLPTADTLKEERIIHDESKYYLVLFSASWCGPCHKQVPLLKELYSKLSSKIEFVYLSVDETETLPGWSDFLQKEKIPWRSLLLYKHPEVRNKYNITAIPTALLISPSGKAETIKINSEEGQAVLLKCLSD